MIGSRLIQFFTAHKSPSKARVKPEQGGVEVTFIVHDMFVLYVCVCVVDGSAIL